MLWYRISDMNVEGGALWGPTIWAIIISSNAHCNSLYRLALYFSCSRFWCLLRFLVYFQPSFWHLMRDLCSITTHHECSSRVLKVLVWLNGIFTCLRTDGVASQVYIHIELHFASLRFSPFLPQEQHKQMLLVSQSGASVHSLLSAYRTPASKVVLL